MPILSYSKSFFIKSAIVFAMTLTTVLLGILFSPVLFVAMAVASGLASSAGMIALASILAAIVGFGLVWGLKKTVALLNKKNRVLDQTDTQTEHSSRIKPYALQIITAIVFATTIALCFAFIPGIILFLIQAGVSLALSSMVSGIIFCGIAVFLAGLVIVNAPEMGIYLHTLVKKRVKNGDYNLENYQSTTPEKDLVPSIVGIRKDRTLGDFLEAKDCIVFREEHFSPITKSTRAFQEEGGCGLIYLARIDCSDGHFWSIIKQDRAQRQVDQLVYTTNEVVYQNLRHPNIVKIYGICLKPAFIVMEYMPGGSLDKLLHHHPNRDIPWELRRKIIKDLVSALAYVHDQSIIHLDVKPANFLFDDKRTGKLSDFGVSVRQSADKPFAGKGCGTRKWAAPEIFERADVKGREITSAADVYSFGATCFEISTQRYPSVERINTVPDECPLDIRILIHVCTLWAVAARPTMRKVQEYLELPIDQRKPEFFPASSSQEKNGSYNCRLFKPVTAVVSQRGTRPAPTPAGALAASA